MIYNTMKEEQQKVSPACGKVSSDMTNIHKEITIDNRIFLKGFKLDTKEEDLENVFKKYGLIVETKIIRDSFNGQSKGFGFITFDSQQVAQQVILSVDSVKVDDIEITVGPAKMRRVPPQSKAFRHYNRFSTVPAQNPYVPPPPPTTAPQYFPMPSPCFVSPDGFFTWFPNTPYQKMSYQDSMPIISEPNGNMLEQATSSTSLEMPFGAKENLKSKENSLENHVTPNNMKYENGLNQIVSPKTNSTSQYQPFNGEMNGKLHPPTPATSLSPDIFHSSGQVGSHYQNNIYLPSTNMMNSGVMHNLPTFLNLNNTNETPTHPSNIFVPATSAQFIPSGVEYKQYENINHPQPQPQQHQQPMVQNNGNVDLAIITSGMATMMPPSYHYVPVTTTQFVPSIEYKQENTGVSESSTYPPPLKHVNPGNVFPIEKSIQDCPTSQSPGKANGNIAMKAQNFVFMSTGPGKVNRVVVH